MRMDQVTLETFFEIARKKEKETTETCRESRQLPGTMEQWRGTVGVVIIFGGHVS